MVSRQAIGLSVAVNEEILFVERVPATRRTEGNPTLAYLQLCGTWKPRRAKV